MIESPRIRRLRSDSKRLQELAARSPYVGISLAEGDPPERYVLHLTCKGITTLQPDGSPVIAESHLLGIFLPQAYPREMPQLRMLTPVFHPNIARNGIVCIGDAGYHGWAPSMGLDDLVVRVIQMIRYENVSLRSAFNEIAAVWASQNLYLFPLEKHQIIGQELPEINIQDPNRTQNGTNSLEDDIILLK